MVLRYLGVLLVLLVCLVTNFSLGTETNKAQWFKLGKYTVVSQSDPVYC